MAMLCSAEVVMRRQSIMVVSWEGGKGDFGTVAVLAQGWVWVEHHQSSFWSARLFYSHVLSLWGGHSFKDVVALHPNKWSIIQLSLAGTIGILMCMVLCQVDVHCGVDEHI